MGCIIRSIYASSNKMVCSSIPQGYTANRWFGPTMGLYIEESKAQYIELAFKCDFDYFISGSEVSVRY